MKGYNLFNEYIELDDPDHSHESSYQKWKRLYHYKKSTTDRRCRNCIYHVAGDYHDKKYHKCKLLGMSHSEATDIRISYVCDHWEQKDYWKLDEANK